MGSESEKKILEELLIIRKLMITDLYMEGVSADDIGLILGVSGRTVQRMIPVKKIKMLKN